MKFRKKDSAEEYELRKINGAYHVVIPIKTLEDVRTFMPIAFGARLTPSGKTSANVISFDSVELIDDESS